MKPTAQAVGKERTAWEPRRDERSCDSLSTPRDSPREGLAAPTGLLV